MSTVNVFSCLLCDDCEGASPAVFVAHLKAAHGVTDTKGRKKFIGHVDYADRYSTSYVWERDGKPFATQYMEATR